jgi:hypothetical protein
MVQKYHVVAALDNGPDQRKGLLDRFQKPEDSIHKPLLVLRINGFHDLQIADNFFLLVDVDVQDGTGVVYGIKLLAKDQIGSQHRVDLLGDFVAELDGHVDELFQLGRLADAPGNGLAQILRERKESLYVVGNY